MIDEFKQWFLEIRDEAIACKQQKAQEKGDANAWRQEIWTSPDKNAAIKARFRDEGEKRGFRSRPSYVSKAGEWLYDFIWREFDAHNNLTRVVLTMEIEVSDHYIKHDFYKLLQADSPYKIMVFQAKHESETLEILESLKNSINAYQSRVEAQYLLCGWCSSKNDFLFAEHHSTTPAATAAANL